MFLNLLTIWIYHIWISCSSFCRISWSGSQQDPRSFRSCDSSGRPKSLRQSCFSLPYRCLIVALSLLRDLLEEFFSLYNKCLWSDEDIIFGFCGRQLREENLQGTYSLSRAVANCFTSPNFKCFGGNTSFRGFNSGVHLTLFLPTTEIGLLWPVLPLVSVSSWPCCPREKDNTETWKRCLRDLRPPFWKLL